MSNLVDEIPMDCPYCDKEITIPVKKIGHTVKCPHCKKSFKTKDKGLKKALRDIDKQLDNLFK